MRFEQSSLTIIMAKTGVSAPLLCIITVNRHIYDLINCMSKEIKLEVSFFVVNK